ncbi:MAG: branched-chain amino acid ABC transporter permease [Deltaproteobacteria bacterium]|nr:branched-chain amino acid ABC transporter permease [Deltaproteobacteria bacterium]
MSSGFRSIFLDARYQLLSALILLLVVPYIVPNLWMLRIFIIANIFAMFAISWNILVGYTGQISFGHAFFFGGGAYASILLNKYLSVPTPIAIIVSGFMCGTAGFILGYPCLRVRGIYLALMTWAFPLILGGVAMYFNEIFGGEMGISGYQGLSSSYNVNYYLSLILLVASVVLCFTIVNSRYGLIIQSIRDNDILAESVGINIGKFKVLFFALSGVMAGISGAFYAHFFKSMTPELLAVDMSILVIIMVIIGGLGSIMGPIIGAYIVTFLNNYLLYVPELRMIIYAVVLILILFFRPKGLLPWSPKFTSRSKI